MTKNTGKGITVVIDPGHGGHDGGARGSSTTEAREVLRIGLAVRDRLRALGYNVVMTRDTDTFVTLGGRSIISNRAKADAFISLHLNSASSSSANGFETFVYNAGTGQSKFRLQNATHGEIMKRIPLRDRGKTLANFAVLRNTVAPAVLIEYGFVNNPKEEAFIKSNTQLLAEATVAGINAYFGVKAGGGTGSNNVANKPSNPSQSPQNRPSDKLDVLDTQLPETLQKDASRLFKRAYDNGVFHEDHSVKVDRMTRVEAYDLLLRYVARTEG